MLNHANLLKIGFLVNLYGSKGIVCCMKSTILGVLSKIMTILTYSINSNSMSNFVPEYWLNWQILVAIFSEFHGQR